MLKKGAAAVFVLLLTASRPAPAEEMKWFFDPSSSSMTYDNGGGKEPVTSFAADVVFNPQELAGSRISFHAALLFAFVPQKAIDPNVRALMNGRQNTGRIPPAPGLAVFVSRGITRTGAGDFSMTGALEIAGRSKDMEVPFAVSIDKSGPMPVMVMKGSFAIDPADFSGGDLPDPGVPQVPVEFEFHEVPAG